jgi:hypothetical protein
LPLKRDTVRALRPFLTKWIDARLDDIENGRIADPDKTIASRCPNNSRGNGA